MQVKGLHRQKLELKIKTIDEGQEKKKFYATDTELRH